MLFETACTLAGIVPVIIIADVIWLLQRNAVLYINDESTSDDEMRLMSRFCDMIGSLPWCVYVVTSIIYTVGTLASYDFMADVMRKYSGDMLVHKMERMSAFGFWVQTGFIVVNIGLIGTLALLNHLRLIKRLEKGKVAQNNPERDTAKALCAAVGGLSNIHSVDNTMTRVRITLVSYNTDGVIDNDALKANGVATFARVGTHDIELIIGGRSFNIASEMQQLLRGNE